RPAPGRGVRMRRPLPAAGWALAAMFLVALGTAHQAARAADQAPQAGSLQLLYDIQQAARKHDYSGVFLYQQGETIQSSRLVHVIDGTGERERLEVLDGQPREYLRHNDELQSLVPERKNMPKEPRRGHRHPEMRLGKPPDLAQ